MNNKQSIEKEIKFKGVEFKSKIVLFTHDYDMYFGIFGMLEHCGKSKNAMYYKS